MCAFVMSASIDFLLCLHTLSNVNNHVHAWYSVCVCIESLQLRIVVRRGCLLALSFLYIHSLCDKDRFSLEQNG